MTEIKRWHPTARMHQMVAYNGRIFTAGQGAEESAGHGVAEVPHGPAGSGSLCGRRVLLPQRLTRVSGHCGSCCCTSLYGSTCLAAGPPLDGRRAGPAPASTL